MVDSERMTAQNLVTSLVDEGTWQSWDTAPGYVALDVDYAAALGRARRRTGVDESVLTGVGEFSGTPIVLVVSEFGFLGGSIGRAAGERVVAAVRRATRERLPVLALPASGGTRMQEGTAAFLQMASIAEAVESHRRAGLPYLVYLRNPTTGGVFASWGSMGHITWAEPHALIGFLGPRVYEGLHHKPFPDGVQMSENLAAQGIVDAIVPVAELAERVGRVVELLAEPDDSTDTASSTTTYSSSPAQPNSSLSESSGGTPWDRVRATRAPGRPGLRDLLGADTAMIHDVGPIVLALSRFGQTTAVVIGQDRSVQAEGRLIGPADLRVARRGLAAATELRLPVVTVIDTPGAELSVAAEEGGLAREIALCLADLVAVPRPTVSVLLGEGAGGAALALFPADRRLAADDAWLSPLPPEGASVIVHRDTAHAPELAAAQGIAATDLAAQGEIDQVVHWRLDVAADVRTDIGHALAGLAPDRARRVRHSADRGGHRILAVGAIIRDDRERFLLVQRLRDPQAGRWTVPGGKVDPVDAVGPNGIRDDADVLVAEVIREIAEETGIDVAVRAQAWVVEIPDGKGGIFEIHDFVAVPVGGTLRAADDAADAGWFTIEEMRGLPLTDGLIEHLTAGGFVD
ncbi:carboxyl transferase domain-containing protein [Gordonia aichiensis]|nr:carboxyl transferase domain-containing protein [Gordonia aichiensis]